MRPYPASPPARRRQILLDLLVVASLLLFAAIALLARDAVLALTAISAGLTESAQDAQERWAAIGEALADVPFLGEALQDQVTGTTAGTVAEAGQAVTAAVTRAANFLGSIIFATPAAVLLVLWVPRRIRRSQGWAAAEVAVTPSASEQVLALRALCHLPMRVLVRYSPQPFDAYAAGDYRPLVDALADSEGVLRRP